MKYLEYFSRRDFFRFPRIGLQILLLLALLLVLMPGAVYAAGVVAVCNEAGLDAALAGGGLVRFTCAGTITIAFTKTITADTTIDGGGAITISGGDAVRVFTVNAGATLNLYNITVEHGYDGVGDGGGIYNNGGTVNVLDSTLSENRANNDGGGIYNTTGGMVNITASTLVGNRADSDGGGIFNANGTVTITNSLLRANLSITGDGGGISNSATLTLTNSTLWDNEAWGVNGGGGIYNSGQATITSSTLSNNEASDHNGGGIYSSGGLLTLTNSTLAGNQANDDGGGIYSSGGMVTLTNSTLSGNQAISGGGIFSGGVVTLTNTIVANHPIGGNCGGGGVGDLGNNLQFGDATCFVTPEIDPLLGLLDGNGGPTLTMALGAGSPAIDGAGACGLTSDQRGVARNDGLCDIGAYEAAAAYTTPTVSFAAAASTVNEAVGGHNITVQLVVNPGPTVGEDVTVMVYDPQSGTATSGADYAVFPLTTATFNCDVAPYCAPGTYTQTITLNVIDDGSDESAETVNLRLIGVTGPAASGVPATHTVTINGEAAPTSIPGGIGIGVSSPSGSVIFDPAISKIGILQRGELGILGERLEWVVTVTNNGGAPGVNVVVTDTLRPELRIDSVNSPVAYTISGQTVTVTIPVLNPGQSVTFSIFTTVLKSDVQVNNTACVARDGLDSVCASAGPLSGVRVTVLPATGETPWWVNVAVVVAMGTAAVLIAGSAVRRRVRS